MLAHSIDFDPAAPRTALAHIPEKAGVFALFGTDERAEPYLSRTPNLRRRLTRFLDAKPTQTKRLRLTERIVRIEYTLTASDFESTLVLYSASLQAFGEGARKRLHLHAPALLRFAAENAYPRVYVTNKVIKSAMDQLFGPFPSRAAAEKFCDEMLNLFDLRRCHEDLHPDPAFPGCIYSEMKKCLAPCYKGCTDERYAAEAAAVLAFLQTRGASLIEKFAAERDTASVELHFEEAAQAHASLQKVEAVASLASPAVQQLSTLSALILQPSAQEEYVDLYLLSRGMIFGPASYSVMGMRHHNEQSGSSSLYVQPVAVQAVPLADESGTVAQAVSRDVLEERLQSAMAELHSFAAQQRFTGQLVFDHLCIFSRWFYRSQARRNGEIIFPAQGGTFPEKQAIRAISRVYSTNRLKPLSDGGIKNDLSS